MYYIDRLRGSVFNILRASRGHKRIGRDCVFRGVKYMVFGHSFVCHNHCRIECINSYQEQKFKPKLKLGTGVNIGYNVHIGVINEILIGANCLLGSNILIIDHDHGDYDSIHSSPVRRPLISKGPINIEDNVWIGDSVAVLGGVTIGKNSIIGTGAVITKDIAPYSVVVGNNKLVRRLS